MLKELNNFLMLRCIRVGRMDIYKLLQHTNLELLNLIDEIIDMAGPNGEGMDLDTMYLCMDILDIRAPIPQKDRRYVTKTPNSVIMALADSHLDYNALEAKLYDFFPITVRG